MPLSCIWFLTSHILPIQLFLLLQKFYIIAIHISPFYASPILKYKGVFSTEFNHITIVALKVNFQNHVATDTKRTALLRTREESGFLHHISNIYDLTPIIEKFQDLLIIFSFLCHPLGPVLAHAGSVAVAAAVDRKGSNAIFIGPLVF